MPNWFRRKSDWSCITSPISLACINFLACSKDAFRFFSVIAKACFAASVIGPGTTATDLLAESMNDEIALSAWSTLFCANSRTCGGTSNFQFGVHDGGILREGFVRLSHFGRARSANPLRSGRTHTILSHAAWHEAPDRDLTVKPQGPNHRASRSVRFGDQGVVGNIDPIILKADPIMAVFRVPIGVCDALTICHRAAESSAALQIVEPLFKR